MKHKLLLFLIIVSYVTSYGKINGNGDKGLINRDSTKKAAPHAKVGNGSGSLGQSYIQQNICGLNYVSATVMTQTRSRTITPPVNTNGTGFPTVLTIAGLPCGGPILKAYAYWDASYTENTAPATSIVITNPAGTVSTTAATTIGTGGSTGWSNPTTLQIEDNAAYRADITAAVNIAGNGNYKVNLTGFANANYEVDGVTIIIIYTDLKATYSGSISIWDGLENNSTSTNPPHDLTATYSGFTVCAATKNTSAFVAIGDAVYGTNQPSQTKNDLNGVYGTFPEGFWQLNIINNVSLTTGQTTTTDAVYTNDDTVGNMGSELDNFVWIVNGLYWQNTTCVTCNPAVLTTTVTATNATCGNNNGTATVTASGGITAYTYAWTPGGKTTATINGLGTGTYSVTVTDACGDISTGSVTITQPTAPTLTTSSTPAACGLNNGSVTVVASGGTSPYSYAWNPSGQTTATATGIGVGSYTVSVTTVGGCITTATVSITQPAVITVAVSIPTNELCNGGNNGSETVTGGGGSSPYTYSWNPSGQTTAKATGLSAGNYTVTVTDNKGCSTTTLVTIAQPPLLTATMGAPTNVLCNGGTGSATVTVTGGTSPYTYSWAPTGGNNATATLSAGNYTVTVIDNNGCTTTASVTITQPTPLGATTTMTQATCGVSNGSATATATGGTPAYKYSWAPSGGTNATANNLSSGSYTVTVTDKNNCTTTSVIVVTSIGGATVSILGSTNELCFGGNNGTATATVSGGASPYTYLWTPSSQTTPTATGLTAGVYTVTVKDNTGCTSAATVTITQPVAIATTISFTPASCNLNNGSATVGVTNGTSPYTYLWTPSAETNATATGIGIGTYTVLVTDHGGCTTTNSVTVTQPSAVQAFITATTGTSCNGGNNGTATANASGGTSSYTYSWATTPTQNTATANGLSAGTYTVTVTDAHGCISTTTAIITQPTLLTVIIPSITNVLCNGFNDGTATSTVTGGTPPYTYAWTPIGGATATGKNLTAGSYTVSVTDHNGCKASTDTTIIQPTPLGTTMSFTPASCNLSNGTATVAVTGGTGTYTYNWAPKGGTNPTTIGISIGTYTVTVKDANGCTTTNSITVIQPSPVVASISNTTGVSCFNGSNGTATATAKGGTSPYTYSWSNGQKTATANGLSAGTYTVTVTDNTACTSTTTAVITQPTLLSVSLSGPPLVCAGVTGTITADVTGGTLPYTYSWASKTNTLSVSPTTMTTYSLTVTDANGCPASAQFTISIGSILTASITGAASVCQNNPVTLCEATAGSTGGNIYTWQPGNYNTPCIIVTPSVTTTYSLSVLDNCGTTATATAIVQINPAPNVAFMSYLQTGCVPLCIQFYNNSSVQGEGIQSYSWTFGNGQAASSKEPIYCYPKSGTFDVTLTVTSDSGCAFTLDKQKYITAYPLPKAAFTFSPQPTSILNSTIQFTDQSTDNYILSQWTWNFGDKSDSISLNQNTSHTYQDTGTFCTSLAVVDQHGCTDTVTNCLVIDPIFTLYIPSAFTPNGDGVDESFMAKGTYIKNFEMYIFDRWGEQLFHSTDINKGWNGTVHGGSTISQEDSYVYKIIATDWENHQHSYIGSVTLIK